MYVYAGFWSSVAGGVVANSLTNSDSTTGVDYQQKKSMKIQQALYGLNFYSDKLDGNLNTMSSRIAIKTLQIEYKKDVTGILSETSKAHLLYLHELFMSLIKEGSKDEIYNEIDDTISLMQRTK
jgi:hypothetical protein